MAGEFDKKLVKLKAGFRSAEAKIGVITQKISSRPAPGYVPPNFAPTDRASGAGIVKTQEGPQVSDRRLTISVERVLSYLARGDIKLLIFDVRPLTEFVAGHVKVSVPADSTSSGVVNLDPRDLVADTNTNSIRSLLKDNKAFLALFEARKQADLVLYYDARSVKLPPPTADVPLRHLFSALFEKEFDYCPKEPVMVEGGWEALQLAISQSNQTSKLVEVGSSADQLATLSQSLVSLNLEPKREADVRLPAYSIPPTWRANQDTLSGALAQGDQSKNFANDNSLQYLGAKADVKLASLSSANADGGAPSSSLVSCLPYLYSGNQFAVPPTVPPVLPSKTLTRQSSYASLLRFRQLFLRGMGPQRGIKNLGNTCFMSCVFQCLYGTVPLSLFFVSGEYRQRINSQNPLGSRGAVVESFAQLMREMSLYDGQPVLNTAKFKETFTRFAPQFQGKVQHDAQEFLSVLLDLLHEDLNAARRGEGLRAREPTKEDEDGPPGPLADKSWFFYRELNQSVVVDFFQGQLENALQCTLCLKESRSFNCLMYLSLPIPTRAQRTAPTIRPGNYVSKGLDLYDCLDEFATREVLDGANAWKCPQCKVPRRTFKALTIARPPNVLLVHLKRFSFDGPFRDKLDTFVDFPLQTLDLTRYVPAYMRAPNEQFLYTLFAVVNHYGTLTGGHYTAFVYDFSTSKWSSFDDTRVSNIANIGDIRTQAAYILFYVRNI